jgi:acyl carrier protein
VAAAAPESTTVALLDAAVHVARLVDSSAPRPMFPVAAESLRIGSAFDDSRAAVKVGRRGGTGDELVVDIVARAPGGAICVDIRSLRYAAMESTVAQSFSRDEPATVAWSEIPAETRRGELQTKLGAILACELGMAPSSVDVDRPFPELGLDSMMAMAVLKEARRLVGIDISATMLWDHPTISSLAAHFAELLTIKEISHDGGREGVAEETTDTEGSVLDALFDSVESATAGSESGI